MDVDAIRARVRRLIAEGVLPCDDPTQTWAGRGAGDLCIACAQPIDRAEVEYEVDFAGSTFRVHMMCHQIWLEECAPSLGR